MAVEPEMELNPPGSLLVRLGADDADGDGMALVVAEWRFGRVAAGGAAGSGRG